MRSRSRSRSHSRSRARVTQSQSLVTRRRLYPVGINANTIYRFKRATAFTLGYNGYSGFTSPNGGTIYGNGLGMAFTLAGLLFAGNVTGSGVSNMPNITEFQALFDEYRIENVEIRIIYTNNVSNTSAALGTFQQVALPTMQSVFDEDDANPPTSGGDLLQMPASFYLFGSNGPYVRNIKPRPANALFTTTGIKAVSTGTSTQWMDTAVTDIQQYGWKAFLEPMGSNTGTLQQGYFNFYVTYTLAFKGFR